MCAVAYFDDNIELPSTEQREKEVASHVAWCKRRYLSNGQLGNSLVFDGILYVDSLLEDMRMQGHKGKGWWRDFTGTVLPADLGKAWDEYLKRAK